jgi:hypothetical protein
MRVYPRIGRHKQQIINLFAVAVAVAVAVASKACRRQRRSRRCKET